MALQTASDITLWALVQQNDQAAFETLYRRYMRVLFAAIYKWTDDQTEAEDILQEVFLVVWERRATIKLKGQLFSYLYAITRNKVFDHIKGRSIGEAHRQSWARVCEDWTDDPNAPPDDALAVADELMIAELEKLPQQMKTIYHLRFRQEMSIPEIAEHLSVSPHTVKNHLKKIRRRLQAAAVRVLSILWCSL
jgi:RNA polymerase sigma-70 factor (family 1)